MVVVINQPKLGEKLELDIIPKGITLQIDPKMMSEIKLELLTAFERADMTRDPLYSKDKISKEVSRLFIKYVGKNPVVIPIIIEG